MLILSSSTSLQEITEGEKRWRMKEDLCKLRDIALNTPIFRFPQIIERVIHEAYKIGVMDGKINKEENDD